MMLEQWAIQWGVSAAALHDLRVRMGLHAANGQPQHAENGHSESWATSQVRMEASRKGVVLFRNNVGAGYVSQEPLDGLSFMRWGLANDSKKVNTEVKSADLVGIRPVVITLEHVGRTIGQFVSREIKQPGWVYRATDREEAQLEWANLIASRGGDAGFATGVGTL